MNSRGQIVLEYVLLLIIGVSLATLIITTMVRRDPENPGFLIKKWVEILEVVGQDQPEK